MCCSHLKNMSTPSNYEYTDFDEFDMCVTIYLIQNYLQNL